MSNLSGHSEKKKKKGTEKKKEIDPDRDMPAPDYWNSVADDVASGYKSKEDKSKILNEDQLPGDNERGDEEPEL